MFVTARVLVAGWEGVINGRNDGKGKGKDTRLRALSRHHHSGSSANHILLLDLQHRSVLHREFNPFNLVKLKIALLPILAGLMYHLYAQYAGNASESK
jgi:hypothetical protein